MGDGHGNLIDWWQSQAKENYLKKTQCVIDQYGNYTVEVDGETLNINGITTQGENIADMVILSSSLVQCHEASHPQKQSPNRSPLSGNLQGMDPLPTCLNLLKTGVVLCAQR